MVLVQTAQSEPHKARIKTRKTKTRTRLSNCKSKFVR